MKRHFSILGGSWDSASGLGFVTYRHWYTSGYRDVYLGLRLVRNK